MRIIRKLAREFAILANQLRYGLQNVSFGEYSKVIGLKNMQIGKNLAVARFLWLEAVSKHAGINYSPKIKIGDNVNISELVHIAAINEIIIGNFVLIGSKVLIGDHNHGCYSSHIHDSPNPPPNRRALHSPGVIIIDDNVFIGDNSIILGNTHIGFGAIIAANSLVVSGTIVQPKTIYAGSPAKMIKKFDDLTKSWIKA